MFNEEQLEDATLSILEELGYERLNGYNIDRDYHSVFMDNALFDDLCNINKDFNDSQIQEAIRTIKSLSHGNPIEDICQGALYPHRREVSAQCLFGELSVWQRAQCKQGDS